VRCTGEETAWKTAPNDLTVNFAKYIEIGVKPLRRLFLLDLVHFPPYPIGGAIKHGDRDLILGGKMVIEARACGCHFDISNLLKLKPGSCASELGAR
jgi:hypothetical protein